MIRTRIAALLGLALLAACGTHPSPVPLVPAASAGSVSSPDTPEASRTGENGILVMAHGGSDEWNEAAARVASALKDEGPTALAFGMANPMTLRAALDSLKTAGVERVAVVRMFLSGSSFRTQTDWLLGMSDERPAHFISHGGHGDGHEGEHGAGHHGAHQAPADPYAQIQHGLAIDTHDDGLMDAPEAAPILLDRARGLSVDPSGESVLLLGHGMGDEEKNDAVLRAMTQAAEPLRAQGFAAVKVATLREDWPEARTVAEADIRSFAAAETEAGRRLLVIPFRLFGFGPYAEVLGDLPHTPGQGLLPNHRIAGWAVRQARGIFCENGWVEAADRCAVRPTVADETSEAERLERPDPQDPRR